MQLGDPILREVSASVVDFRGARAIVADLRATLHAFRRAHGFGRGISAIQIGRPMRVIYLEFEGTPCVLINPRYERRSRKKFRLWDDCFSFPGLLVRVERSLSVRVKHQDISGDWRVLEGTGALSELLQHEMDHLDGILAVDRAIDRFSLSTRAEYERRLKDTGNL